MAWCVSSLSYSTRQDSLLQDDVMYTVKANTKREGGKCVGVISAGPGGASAEQSAGRSIVSKGLSNAS